MTPILTREQMRNYDRHAIEVCGVPSLVLMENAGRSAADVIEREIEPSEGPVVVIAGHGQNGGDGFVLARHLRARHVDVEVFVVDSLDEVTGDARVNLDALRGLGMEVETADDLEALRRSLCGAQVVVDAIFGTGLTRPVTGRLAEIIALINDAPCRRVALDIPSGIDANDGRALGVAVRADLTITFGHAKAGLYQGAAVRHTGDIVRVGLGIPDDDILAEIGRAADVIEAQHVITALGPRPRDVHKHRAGNVLVAAGSVGKTGAALLVANAALRTGAGLATIATWPDALASIESRVLEIMTHPLDKDAISSSAHRALERRDAVAIGPGLGLDAKARSLCDAVALGWDGPVVLDADAITHFAHRDAALEMAPGPRVLTPHAGELARLLDATSAEIEEDRFESALTAAERTGAVVVLKGPYTVVATPGGDRFVCDEVNPLLATAGSGDVLTGIIAALLCTAPDPAYAAAAGVLLHATAARIWSELHDAAPRGMLAGDIAEMVPLAIAHLTQPAATES